MTELEQFRTMLNRIDVDYTERPTDTTQTEFFRSNPPQPGWISLFPVIGYIETELVFDPDGNLAYFWQNE